MHLLPASIFMHQKTLSIGCAAGFGGDRTDAALPIVETLIARGGCVDFRFIFLMNFSLQEAGSRNENY